MKATEYMFRFPGCGNEPSRYSVIVLQGVSVTFIRIGSAQKPFSLLVPRAHDATFAHVRAEDLARLAIAQAICAELLEADVAHALDLDVHGPLWDGELDAGQWQHDTAEPVLEAAPAVAQTPAAPPVVPRHAESGSTIFDVDFAATAAAP
ncbi:hypothetical protein [Paraburkholderia bannensis]|uniref:hypothetical protein n=1 Tax=Paraburkholderia bannensis TaxID=765414 RepID=UPI0004821253|nr:hypothetical protein [Paraburkholderia bannensis]